MTSQFINFFNANFLPIFQRIFLFTYFFLINPYARKLPWPNNNNSDPRFTFFQYFFAGLIGLMVCFLFLFLFLLFRVIVSAVSLFDVFWLFFVAASSSLNTPFWLGIAAVSIALIEISWYWPYLVTSFLASNFDSSFSISRKFLRSLNWLKANFSYK